MKSAIVNFLNDEDGGYTIWGLTWFMIYLAIGGLAVDVTDAYRNQILLQSTADSASLAGVMSLPDENAAVTEAVAYAQDNLNQANNGVVLNANEVFIGSWDFTTRTFTEGTVEPNAVRVITRRSAQNNNPVAMNLLRILALAGVTTSWDISTEAIAVGYTPDCLEDGMIAMNQLNISSNNGHVNDICLHGQTLGVELQNGNSFEDGVSVSMPDLGLLSGPTDMLDSNPGLEDALREGDMYPRDVDRINEIVDGLRAMDPNYLPDFMVDIAPGTGVRTVKSGVTQVQVNNHLPAALLPNTVYNVNCNGQILLPSTVMNRVVIVADCRIHTSAGSALIDAVLATDFLGGADTVQLASSTMMGLPDNCASGGGVEIYSAGDIHVSASGDFNGVRMVSANDVKFTSNSIGISGMSVQAGNDINYSSNNSYGLCSGGVPGPMAIQYRLVH
ncbi:MAG: pilus assembly protein TadG-related protein [Paracoccaceae bacterium]|nr:pilus assembly protein TadG-related protein [Paracoccaceae bacterium]